MRKFYKRDLRLVIVLVVCIILSIFLVLGIHHADADCEEPFYSAYLADEENLHLKSDVYVITLPASGGDAMTAEEKEKEQEEILTQIEYLVSDALSSASGIYILGTEFFSDLSMERRAMPFFREAGNVFWHYSTKNTGYYYPEDNCGQIKFLDKYYGGENYFEVFGEGKYARGFLPYFFMTMDGGTVKYDDQKHVYTYREASGMSYKLYAEEDGTIRTKETEKQDVSYFGLGAFYEVAKKYEGTDKYDGAIVFFQDRKKLSEYSEGVSSELDLADYYVDVLGTIENGASLKTFHFPEKLAFVLSGVLILGVTIVFMTGWIGLLMYLLEIAIVFSVNFFLVEKNICYMPVATFLIALTVTLVIMQSVRFALGRISAKNLPIDAVIRFTRTIVKIEHSVSYSEYLMKNRGEIENDISASLLLPVMDRESFLLKELAEENHRNRRFVETEFWGNNNQMNSSVVQARSRLFQGMKYVAFVPLPVFDVESEAMTYTVIGLKKKLKTQKASYISMMLFSMYIYFKAQHERGEHQRMYFSMLSLMISVIDAKDPVTAGHSQRVASISKDIGIWLNLSKNEQFDLEFTALLHDIGKIGVSDYVLNKQSVYTKNDIEQMKYHTIRGAEMLSEVGISKEIIDGVRHHHERIDGKGYPDGLKGEDLHLFAKIIKIADVYDALTSKRQYKEAWEIDKALNIIYKGRGTEFDSEIADVFIEHMSPPGWIPPVSEGNGGKRKDPNLEKAARIANDFYRRYREYLSVEYPIASKKPATIDFFRENGFMQYDWGENFDNSMFLEEKPMILSYEKETKSLIFGQTSNEHGVSSIYYYFFKGFVNMGIYLLMPSDTKSILAKLTEKYGTAQVMDEQMMIYEVSKMKIVFYRTFDEKYLLFYISDYMCSNYIFDGKE